MYFFLITFGAFFRFFSIFSFSVFFKKDSCFKVIFNHNLQHFLYNFLFAEDIPLAENPLITNKKSSSEQSAMSTLGNSSKVAHFSTQQKFQNRKMNDRMYYNNENNQEYAGHFHQKIHENRRGHGKLFKQAAPLNTSAQWQGRFFSNQVKQSHTNKDHDNFERAMTSETFFDSYATLQSTNLKHQRFIPQKIQENKSYGNINTDNFFENGDSLHLADDSAYSSNFGENQDCYMGIL